MRIHLIHVIIFLAGIFFAFLVMFFMLVLGVQHGDTYKGQNHPSFGAAAKYVVKRFVHEVKNGVYYEATIHNPAGDTIPDEWDNTLIYWLKKTF